MATEDQNSIPFDEKLSEAVRQHSCIYDKADKDYKEQTAVANAWTKVAEDVGLEEGERARRMFENLKKRLSKRRSELKKAEMFGSPTSVVAVSKERFDQFNFMSWLAPHIQPRSPKTNSLTRNDARTLPSLLATHRAVSIDGSYDAPPENKYQASNSEEGANSFVQIPSRKRRSEGPNTSVITEKEKLHKGNNNVSCKELTVPQSNQKITEEPKTESPMDENHYFGLMIAAEIRKLSPRNQLLARHEMQNVLFNIQMQEQHELLSSE